MIRNLFEELKEGIDALRNERSGKIDLKKTHREANESIETQKPSTQHQSTQKKSNEK